jgi:hypothetical protein
MLRRGAKNGRGHSPTALAPLVDRAVIANCIEKIDTS